MTVTPQHAQHVDELVRRLDQAMVAPDDEGRCRNVKKVLTEMLGSGTPFLDPRYLAPTPDHYARRLLHRDPQGRYTAVVMVWDQGQGTPLHDHAGMWCVECVYRGRIEVTAYSVTGGEAERGVVHFREESRVFAGVGESGALIPPFEYHRLRNAGASPAVTLHVYGGEMTRCHVFDPLPEGGYIRRSRDLAYTV